MSRSMTRLGIAGLFAVNVSLCAWAQQGVDLAAMQGWDIVVAEDAIASERYAAEEFRRFFKRASGVELPLVTKTQRPGRHVFIGPGELMQKSIAGFDSKAMGDEDLRIVIRGDHIAIAGGRPRGTLYGVYTFLEDYLGVRFLTVDHTHVPKIGQDRVIGPVDRVYRPPLEFRWSFYSETNKNPAFAARIRNNTSTGVPKVGGRSGISLINHSFHRQLSAKDYGKEHPEYFALIKGGRRLDIGGGGPQLCLTNPDVLKIVTEAVFRELKANPTGRNVSVSQNDNREYCRCANCAAIDNREGTPMGSLLTFVNAVADEVAKKRPDVMVGTLSYQYTRQTPKTIRPRPNVQIQLCSIECCLIHAIDDPACPKNVAFCRDMADWGKICKNIYIWNYNTNFSNYLLPCPNLRVIEPNIRYFVANHARGVFMQAVYTTPTGELSDLRNYVMANLLWDPNRSGRKLRREFVDLHYGRAAEPIRQFIELVHNNAGSAGVHPNCFGRAKDYAVDESIARSGLSAFEEAMKLADSDDVRRRVEKASICAYRAAIEPIWYVNDPGRVDPALAKRMRPLVQRFVELCEKYGVVQDREGRSFERARTRIRLAVGL